MSLERLGNPIIFQEEEEVSPEVNPVLQLPAPVGTLGIMTLRNINN